VFPPLEHVNGPGASRCRDRSGLSCMETHRSSFWERPMLPAASSSRARGRTWRPNAVRWRPPAKNTGCCWIDGIEASEKHIVAEEV